MTNSAKNGKTESIGTGVLLDRVKMMLKNTEPSAWRRGGGPFNPTERFDKPRESWEWVYSVEVTSGVLCFRYSLPVRAEFAGRGFGLTPLSKPIFTVEMRSKGWHHSVLTDPYKRMAVTDKSFQLLADGQMAEEIFTHVAQTLESHHAQQYKNLEAQAQKIVKKLLVENKDSGVIWDSIPNENNMTHYQTESEGCVINIFQATDKFGKDKYAMNIVKDDYRYQVKDLSAITEIYKKIIEFGATSRLLELTKALEEI